MTMKNKQDMVKWLNNLKSDIGQPQHSQLWHYAEILDVIAKYLESTESAWECCAGCKWEYKWAKKCEECSRCYTDNYERIEKE